MRRASVASLHGVRPAGGRGRGLYDGFFGRARGRFCHRFRGPGGFWHGAGHRPHQAAQLHFQHRFLLFFHPGGKVVWSVGLCMALGQFIRARMGSKLVLKKGVKLIKPLLVTVSPW